MPGDADALARWLADRLVTGSLQGAILIVVIWLAARRLRGIPASVQATLWWLVALKLLVTLVPIPSLSLPVLPARAPASAVQTNLAMSRVTDPTASPAAAEASAERAPRGTPTGAGAANNRWLMALIGIWCVGLGVHAVRLLSALRTVRGAVRRSAPAASEDIALVVQLARVVGLTRVPDVRVSGDVDSPQLAGVRRPIVLVPLGAAVALTPEERAMALCHELVHARRHDLAMGWVPVLAQHVFFFHPLVRLAGREYLTAREAACDAAVVSTLGVSPNDYGQLLLRVGVRGSVPAFAAGGASPSVASLRRRLEMLQHVGYAGAVPPVAWCIAAVMLTAMLPLELVARAPSRQAPASAAPVSRAHDTPDALAAVPNTGAPESSEALRMDVPKTLPRRAVTTSDSAAGSQSREAASAEQHVLEERRQAIDELRWRLAYEAEETLQASRLQDAADIQRLWHRLAEVRDLREGNFAATELAERRYRDLLGSAGAVQDAREEMIRLRVLVQQRDQLAREEHTLLRLQQELAVRQEVAAAAQHQAARSTDSQPAAYTRGQVVWLTPTPDGTRLPTSTILAVPGDRIDVSRAGVIVNGTPVTDLSPDFVAGLPEDTWAQTLPPGHYFLAGEERTGSSVIRFWGLIPADRIAGTP